MGFCTTVRLNEASTVAPDTASMTASFKALLAVAAWTFTVVGAAVTWTAGVSKNTVVALAAPDRRFTSTSAPDVTRRLNLPENTWPPDGAIKNPAPAPRHLAIPLTSDLPPLLDLGESRRLRPKSAYR